MILVEHATIVTLDADRRILADGSLLFDGRDIVQVGPAREVRPPRPPDRVIDGRRRLVLPGFVDTHVHLSEHINRGLLRDDIPVDRYLPDRLVPGAPDRVGVAGDPMTMHRRRGRSMTDPVATSRRAPARPGGDRAWGGWGPCRGPQDER